MAIHRSTVDGTPLIEITADCDRICEEALREAIMGAVATRIPPAGLFIDLTHCPFLDSSAIAALLVAAKAVHRHGWLGLIAASANVRRLLELTALVEGPKVKLFGSREEAFAFLSREE